MATCPQVTRAYVHVPTNRYPCLQAHTSTSPQVHKPTCPHFFRSSSSHVHTSSGPCPHAHMSTLLKFQMPTFPHFLRSTYQYPHVHTSWGPHAHMYTLPKVHRSVCPQVHRSTCAHSEVHMSLVHKSIYAHVSTYPQFLWSWAEYGEVMLLLRKHILHLSEERKLQLYTENARDDKPHSPFRCEIYFENSYMYSFALMSRSFKDFPFLDKKIGGCLNIWRSNGWFCIRCHFLIKASFKLDIADGWYCVAKGKISFIFCCSV